MSANPLFNFLEATHPELYILKHNQHDQAYYLHSLRNQVGHQLALGELQFRVKEHHLSVYHDVLGFGEAKASEYHFTSTLTQNGNDYKLHLYFDKQDQCISCKLTEPDQTPVSLAEEDQAILISYGLSVAQGSISQLRSDQLSHVRSLKAQVNSKLAELEQLSKHLPVNGQSYISKARDVIAHLKTLIPLVHDSEFYKGQGAFLQSVIDHLDTHSSKDEAEPLSAKANADDEASASSDAAESSTAQIVLRLADKPRPVIGAEEKALFIEQMTVASTQRLLLEDEPDFNKQFQLICAYRDAVTAAQSTSATYTVLTDDLLPQAIELNQFQLDLRQTGSEYLKRLLVGGQFDDAQQLTEFLLTDMAIDLAQMAIMFNNHELLQFITKNSELPLKTMMVSPPGKEAVAAAQYCFDNQKVDCFKVLVKCSVDLMLPSAKGLPLAYNMYVSKQCSTFFKGILEYTFSNPLFLKSLSRHLQFYLDNHTELPQSQRQQIQRDIDLFVATRKPGDSLEQKMIATLNETEVGAMQALGLSECDYFRDPRFLENQARIQQLNDNLLKLLNPAERRGMMAAGRKEVESVFEFKSLLKGNIHITVALALEMQQAAINILEIDLQIGEVNQDLKRGESGRVHAKRLSRADRQRNTQLSQLQVQQHEAREVYTRLAEQLVPQTSPLDMLRSMSAGLEQKAASLLQSLPVSGDDLAPELTSLRASLEQLIAARDSLEQRSHAGARRIPLTTQNAKFELQ